MRRLERFAIAHAAAYPIAFLWAVACMPLCFHLFARTLDALGNDEQAVARFVVRRVAWPAGVVFVLPHVLALPWAFGRESGRWRRLTWGGIAGVAALGVVLGASSWLWLFLR